MKKLLTIFGSISLTTTTSFLVIACKESKQFDNKITEPNNNKIDDNKTIKENKEKTDFKKEDKNEIHKNKLTEEVNKDKKDQEEQIQNNQPRENDQYQPKRSNEDNFRLIKEYGKEIVDFLFPEPTKLSKLYSNAGKDPLSKLIGEMTSFYSEIAKYSNIDEFQSKTKKYDFRNGNLYRQFDEIVTNYETQKDNIWALLKSI
ncbi:lipoprotein [Mycoplasma capricolum subsp. capricolum]|uniref:lipoprotein n=1 Tax=Mycoplasma capricolum TaxID=2095 RepID=UPI003DA5369D